MGRIFSWTCLLSLWVLRPVPAIAQIVGPCDTDTELRGACDATIDVAQNGVILRADTSCAVVEWRADGTVRTTVVVDGEKRVDLAPVSEGVAVEDCTIVDDLRVDRECASLVRRLERIIRGVTNPDRIDRRRRDLIRRLPPGCCVPRSRICGEAPQESRAPPEIRIEPVPAP